MTLASRRTFLPACALAAFVLTLAAVPGPAQGEKPRPAGWTADEALLAVGQSPNDPYLQYVAAQLARREGKLDQVLPMLQRTPPAANPGRSADLFSTFTAATAIQESLQLDTMRGGAPGAAPANPAGEPVKVASLTGPTVQSHPWEKLLGAKTPDVGPLAGSVPHDFYFAEFRSVAKLTEATTAGNVWGSHLFTQVLGRSRSQFTLERVKAQLGLAAVPADLVDRLGVEGVAVVGSDLFVAEGSDVTLLVKGKGIARLADAISKGEAPDVKREEKAHVGIAFTHLSSAGDLNAYVATPTEDLHLRGNSLPAFLRVLEAVAGKDADGKPAKRLGETAEFRYLRTLMPRDAADEDGFVYLSDAFIRHMVGPRLKLTERRRVLAYNHLRMIGHACLMFRTETGRAPKSLAELAEARCAPGVFGEGALAHPDGGTYSLSADGMSGVCSKYGTAAALTPCLERPLAEVPNEEAEEYRRFVTDYEQYWRTYFDPIAVRVKVTPAQLRLETLILPLIDNSIYTQLARAVGGKPVALDTLPVPKSCIGSVVLQINKEPLKQFAADGEKRPPGAAEQAVNANTLKQIGLAMHNHHDAYGALPTSALRDPNGKPLLSWRVAILPFVEENELYKEFKLDEPWDSEHNKKLVAKMPRIYQRASKTNNEAGKTNFTVPVGKDTLFPPGGKGATIAAVTDGTSNTVLAVQLADDAAVVWTKPDDWEFDPKAPTKNLAAADGAIQVLMADGEVRRIAADRAAKDWAALFTVAGGEPIDFLDEPDARSGFSFLDLPIPREFLAEIDDATVRRFLTDGLGDQIGVHMFDESRLIDFDFNGVLDGGDALGTNLSARDRLGIGLLVQMLIRPVAISVPVKDVKLTDEMLAAFDRWSAESAAKAGPQARSFLPVASDFYRVTFPAPHVVRCAAVKFFGFKIRFFWGRIGNGLYVANRPFVLEDIARAYAEAEKGGGAKPAPVHANAMLRLRPENWNRVLPGYRLGWAENDRDACRANLSLVESVGRGWNDRGGEVDAAVMGRIGRVYGARPVCPEGGRYSLSPAGRVCRCSVHGSRADPTQPAVPTDASASGRLMKNLSGVTATLTFLDDGLRAVVTVDRAAK